MSGHRCNTDPWLHGSNDADELRELVHVVGPAPRRKQVGKVIGAGAAFQGGKWGDRPRPRS